jgi:hypothetical protein
MSEDKEKPKFKDILNVVKPPPMKVKADYDIVLQRTAVALGLTEKQVYDISRSVFEFMHELVESGNYEGFYFRYLGRFIVKPYRLKRILEAKSKKKSKKDV